MFIVIKVATWVVLLPHKNLFWSVSRLQDTQNSQRWSFFCLFFFFFNSKSYFSSVAHLMVYIFEYLLKAVLGLVQTALLFRYRWSSRKPLLLYCCVEDEKIIELWECFPTPIRGNRSCHCYNLLPFTSRNCVLYAPFTVYIYGFSQ